MLLQPRLLCKKQVQIGEGGELTQEQLQNESGFRASAAVLQFMLDQDWLDEKEYKYAVKHLLLAYRPLVGSLWCK